MPEVVITMRFCYGHRLVGYAGKCSRLHGHNAKVEVVLESRRLDDQGFVVDFSEAKRLLKEVVDKDFDHLMILKFDDPVADVLAGMGETLKVINVPPTAEYLAEILLEKARHTFHLSPLPCAVVEVRFWETDDSMAVAR